MDELIAPQHNDSGQTVPRVSVLIATRNRGLAIRDALNSVRASTIDDWELIVIDQSTSDDTEAVMRLVVEADPRVRYVRSATTGVSTARNVGLRVVRAPFVAITDDDCEVAPDWLARIIDAFETEPAVAFICGTLAPAPFDSSVGQIPHSSPAVRQVVRRPWPLIECVGGNIAVRRSVLDGIGLFDEKLGPGAVFSCSEDQDLCHRVLLAGYSVLVAPEIRVIHHGYRSNAEMPEIWKRDSRGIGGLLAKEFRCGAPQALIELASFWGHWIKMVLGRIVTFQRPLKFRQTRAYVLGTATSFVLGLRYPVARHRRVYMPQSWLGDL